MKIHLIDVDASNGQEEQMGTCEVCFWTGWCDNPVFIFKTEDDKKIAINGYWWEWGDYYQVDIDNVINFEAWLSNKDWGKGTEFDLDWLIECVDQYEQSTGYGENNAN